MEKPRGLPSEPHSGDQASWELAIMNEVNSMRSPTDITQFRHDQLQSISCRAVQVRGKVNAFVFFATTAWNVDNTLVGSGKASRLNWDEVWMLSGLHDVQKYQLHAFGTEPARQTVRNGGGTEAQRVGPIGNFTDVNMQHVMGASRFWAALYLKTYGRPEKVTEWLKERPSILMFIYSFVKGYTPSPFNNFIKMLVKRISDASEAANAAAMETAEAVRARARSSFTQGFGASEMLSKDDWGEVPLHATSSKTPPTLLREKDDDLFNRGNRDPSNTLRRNLDDQFSSQHRSKDDDFVNRGPSTLRRNLDDQFSSQHRPTMVGFMEEFDDSNKRTGRLRNSPNTFAIERARSAARLSKEHASAKSAPENHARAKSNNSEAVSTHKTPHGGPSTDIMGAMNPASTKSTHEDFHTSAKNNSKVVSTHKTMNPSDYGDDGLVNTITLLTGQIEKAEKKMKEARVAARRYKEEKREAEEVADAHRRHNEAMSEVLQEKEEAVDELQGQMAQLKGKYDALKAAMKVLMVSQGKSKSDLDEESSSQYSNQDVDSNIDENASVSSQSAASFS